MSQIKVLITAAEGMPFVKTGGLADVVGALPKELVKLGVEAAVMLPKHRIIKERYGDRLTLVASMNIAMGWRNLYMGVETMEMEGIRYYFIDNEFISAVRYTRGETKRRSSTCIFAGQCWRRCHT
jgi:starch synthase